MMMMSPLSLSVFIYFDALLSSNLKLVYRLHFLAVFLPFSFFFHSSFSIRNFHCFESILWLWICAVCVCVFHKASSAKLIELTNHKRGKERDRDKELLFFILESLLLKMYEHFFAQRTTWYIVTHRGAHLHTIYTIVTHWLCLVTHLNTY